jgi:hypothetical protein
MPWKLIVLCVLAVACTSGTGTTTSTTGTPTTIVDETTSTTPPVECPPPPYQLGYLPAEVGETPLDPTDIDGDVWTEVPATSSILLARPDGSVGIALVRGTLPVVDWPGEKGEVTIDGTRAVVGPHPDGTWVAGWFEAPGERCDLYTMVFYPPIEPDEVELVIGGMNRVGG